MNYASFLDRVLASLIDWVILYIISALIGFAVGIFLGIVGVTAGLENISRILGLIIGWLYYALSESSLKQATLGKQAMGITVTDMDGNRISFPRATGRYFSKIISTITLLIGYLMAAFTAKKQALHDIIAGTLVIKN
jgi:uncharacterized RDD family membrane protein YckC